MTSHPRPGLRPLFFIIVLAVAFLRFWDHTIIAQDSFVFFAPHKQFLAQSLRQGVFPLWDPRLFLGMPFAAEVQAGVFYPLNILFLIFEFGAAHRLFILCHYPLAAWSMDLFLRSRGRSSSAAILGGLVFALSGYMISQHALVRMALGGAWAPLVLYAVDRARSGRLWWSAAAGAALCLQVLASDPETAAITAVLAVILAAADRQPRRGLTVIAVMGVMALLLAAVQVAPTAEMMALSSRAHGLTLDQAEVFSFHPAGLLELLWPTPYGLQWPGYFYWGGFTINAGFSQVPWSATNYLGLPVIILAALGLGRGPKLFRIGTALGLALFLLLALGQYTPVYGWVHALVPVFNSFRYPSKYLIGLTGLIAFAAAAGLDAVSKTLKENPGAAQRPAGAFLALAALTALAGYLLWPLALARLAPFAPDSFQYNQALAHLHRGALHLALVSLAAAAALILAARQHLAWDRARLIIIAAVVLDLGLANISIMPAGPPDLYAVTPALAQAISPAGPPPAGRFRVFRDLFKFPDHDPNRSPYNHYTRQTVWERDTLKRNLSAFYGFEDIASYGSYELQNGRELFQTGMSPDLMSLFNLRYIIRTLARPPIESVATDEIFRDETAGVAVLELQQYWPRAYWVGNAAPAADDGQALDRLREVNPKTTVVITTDQPLPVNHPEPSSMVPADITAYGPNQVEIAITTPAPGWLVLSDRSYPGWKADLDGAPAAIHRANVVVRAVRIETPGAHRVTFSFRPNSVLAGAVVSAAAWVLFIAWALAPLISSVFRPKSQT